MPINKYLSANFIFKLYLETSKYMVTKISTYNFRLVDSACMHNIYCTMKFLHKLYHNNLPVYFEGYWEHLTKTELEYNLRSRMLPVPRIHHVYAESLFVYQLIKILNEFDNSVIIKLKERSHSFPGFSNYVTLKFINNYSDQKICNIPYCYACKRN